VEKEKGRGEVGRRGRRVGLLGPKGSRAVFSLFFLLFSNFIFKSFFISNSIQTFSNFSQEFYRNFLETTQATKNHASQLMMHIHLLSLSLLNYL
jgi:hypothetical protein